MAGFCFYSLELELLDILFLKVYTFLAEMSFSVSKTVKKLSFPIKVLGEGLGNRTIKCFTGLNCTVVQPALPVASDAYLTYTSGGLNSA